MQLAQHLAARFDYPFEQVEETPDALGSPKPKLSDKDDLPRVSQYVADVRSPGSLYENLHKVFNADYPPTTIHRFVAALASVVRPLLVLTTNYDDVLERTYKAAGLEYRLITYVADSPLEYRGRFMHSHWRPGAIDSTDEPKPIDNKRNKCADLLTDGLPVIAKIHGTVRRGSSFGEDSYVITESDFVEYLTDSDAWNVLPSPIRAKVKESHLLFLGYGLHDWNLRVMLHRAWSQQVLSLESWAVRRDADAVDVTLWKHRRVTTLPYHLKTFIAALGAAFLKALLEELWHRRPKARRAALEDAAPEPLLEWFLDAQGTSVSETLPDAQLRALLDALPDARRERLLAKLPTTYASGC